MWVEILEECTVLKSRENFNYVESINDPFANLWIWLNSHIRSKGKPFFIEKKIVNRMTTIASSVIHNDTYIAPDIMYDMILIKCSIILCRKDGESYWLMN